MDSISMRELVSLFDYCKKREKEIIPSAVDKFWKFLGCKSPTEATYQKIVSRFATLEKKDFKLIYEEKDFDVQKVMDVFSKILTNKELGTSKILKVERKYLDFLIYNLNENESPGKIIEELGNFIERDKLPIFLHERLDIVRLCADKDPGTTAKYFGKFKIKNESTRLKIASVCLEGNPKETIRNIQNFQIGLKKLREFYEKRAKGKTPEFTKVLEGIDRMILKEEMSSEFHAAKNAEEKLSFFKARREQHQEDKELLGFLYSLVREEAGELGKMFLEKSREGTITEMPPIPFDGIRVGLPNVSEKGSFGNTCWLNSTLKWLASTHFFDDIYIREIGPKEFQVALREIVIILRTAKNEILDKTRYKNFLELLRKHIKGFEEIGEQEDAPEFLVKLLEVLQWNESYSRQQLNDSGLYPRFVRVYKPTEKNPKLVKYGNHDDAAPIVSVTLPQELSRSKESIDLEERLVDKSAVPDLKAENGVKGNFEFGDYFSNLPRTMCLYLKRFYFDYSRGQRGKITNRVKINDDGTITFTEYRIERDEENHIIGAAPYKNVSYQIVASISQRGGLRGGHYVCEERTESGKRLIHSDTSIVEDLDVDQLGLKDGVVLRLERVGERII